MSRFHYKNPTDYAKKFINKDQANAMIYLKNQKGMIEKRKIYENSILESTLAKIA